MKFPLYRKYANSRNYFKIINPHSFEEVQVLGEKRLVRLTEARLYPEKIFISDLIGCTPPGIVEISDIEYNAQRKNAVPW
jgi:hypothetical protein